MMHVLPCAQVREDLQAYHDGEVSIDTQVLIQSHLQECVACRLEAAALADLGDALRAMAGAVPGRRAARDTGLISRAVLDRIRVEDRFSLVAQVRESFEDMHLVWAGLGATFAMIICVFASAGVLQAASNERPDSLAGIISTIARGSDPIRLAASPQENKPLLDTTESLPGGIEGDLMLSAFITRDGRIQNVAVLEEEARAKRVKPDAVLAMIEAASRARFSPSPNSAFVGGVNVVWLVTSTTVKGRADYDLYLVSPPRLSAPVFGPPAPVPVKPSSTPSAKGPSTTAGDDFAAC